jgi:hypothetical protein
MRARQHDLDLIALLPHIENHHPNSLADLVGLARNALAARQKALGAADVHE